MSYTKHNFETGDILYASQLNEMDDQIAANEEAIENSVSSDMLAEDYSANKTYSIGDYVIYNNELYTCIYEITAPEGWNSSHWSIANLGDGISELNRQISELDTDITTLKSKIDEIAIPTSNRLNVSAMTPNTYINVDGTSTASQNFSVTDYISVTSGETIYWWSDRGDSFYLFDARFLCAYDANKNAVAASGGTFVGGSYVVPNGISYIRLSISNTYLTNWTRFYAGTHQVGVDYEEYGYEIVNQPQVDQNTENIAQISMPSSNLLDTSKLTAYYIPADGSVNASDVFHVTDYLPVTPGQYIYGWGKNGSAYTAITFRFVCAYDSAKTAVSAKGSNSEMTPPFIVPDGISFLRITIRNAVINYDDLYIGTHNVGVNYEDYGLVPKIPNSGDSLYSVRSGGSILVAVKYCYENDIKNLVVEAGTYDLIAEYKAYYGNDYFDNYIDYSQGDVFDAGIWLQNINVKFSPGAKVVCKYTGDNTNVSNYFSAFATGNNVTIDGLVLDSENLRYGIHADYNTGTDNTFFVVKNSDLKHYKNSTSMQAIGAGFGVHVSWLIENTIFRSAGGNHIVFRVHNNVNASAQSKMVVRDCYIDGDGYFQFNSYSTSTTQSIIQVCGCSYKTAPVVGKETVDSNDNFTMIAWNNEVRT